MYVTEKFQKTNQLLLKPHRKETQSGVRGTFALIRTLPNIRACRNSLLSGVLAGIQFGVGHRT